MPRPWEDEEEGNPKGVPLFFYCIRFPAAIYSPTVKTAVPSTLEGLTAGFGMGPGVSPPP